jgi:hypothetical protein
MPEIKKLPAGRKHKVGQFIFRRGILLKFDQQQSQHTDIKCFKKTKSAPQAWRMVEGRCLRIYRKIPGRIFCGLPLRLGAFWVGRKRRERNISSPATNN